ncbi:hypothetical protein [Sphingobacterium sp. IITKGP-BTPF85]|uniref:hypothetical protein n=1 Tax=Sphingobacterium sp. IITKGP-BTPF85 TaxID=1338009 RepID=UPI00038A5254|nr:hypothetical protein [Sphingobacterium sp. IITKGP-BTPF85]KKX47300.1 hypothetical protein L950_0227245 [Sphingobacterium sp. IITKGP-BTPF85]
MKYTKEEKRNINRIIMQQKKTSKGQSGRQPKNGRYASSMMSYESTAMSCRTAGQIMVNRRSLFGNCCCAGPVRDAHGRRFTTFPRKWYMEKFLVK